MTGGSRPASRSTNPQPSTCCSATSAGSSVPSPMLGLKTDAGTLSFNLRNDNSGGGQQQANNDNAQQGGSNGNRSSFNPDGSLAEDTAPAGLIEMVWHLSPDRVDVRI
jgi:hypothetical protein